MLTVFFATKNREKLLAQVLESFCLLESPASGWKLVVVDNGSSDDTRRVLDSFTRRLPLQVLSESKPGKNSALNTGLQLLEGDLAVFSDDDVFPRADWLIQLSDAADAQPDFAMFGGAVEPRWEIPPPHWIDWIDLGPVFTLTESGRPAGEIHPALVFGPNMAIRSRVFKSGIRFNPSIGPQGSSYAMGSESELTTRLAGVGEKAFFVPQAVVQHFIRRDQLKTSWVIRRAFRYGRGFFRLFRTWEATGDNVGKRMGIPKPLIHEMIDAWVDLGKAVLSLKRQAIFRARFQVSFLYGQAVEARSLIRENRAAEQAEPYAN
jgi:glycosyltransferase involved in cell wall biosynthesis